MELKRRNYVVYGLLAFAWVLVLAWQIWDHARVKQLARQDLIHRAQDVSTTVATTMRAFRRWGNLVNKERLESALKDLLRPGEWEGIGLLNESGDVVAEVGRFTAPDPKGPAEVWAGDTVTLMNLVALGTNVTRDLEGTNTAVIVETPHPGETNRPAFGPGPRPGEPDGPPRPRPGERPPDDRGPGMDGRRGQNGPGMLGEDSTNSFRPPRGGLGRMRFSRPWWMSEEDWKAMQEKQGVHSFAIVMSTKAFIEASRRDLWQRAIIVTLATIAVFGYGIAWGNQTKTSDLQIRLVRASELNTHLKELNLAAAGLAHETRNPLNIIRGMAQMISKQPGSAPEVQEKSRAIVDESDKVTAQLNEFINYSRPREVRRSPLKLNSIITEVVRALSYDIEEKKIRVEVKGDQLTVDADEQLLRQVLFNLVLNAIQAVGQDGEIQILAQRTGASEASIEVRDNGPGVPPERRAEIFKPYFTTQAKGTGLGLAIVQQNALAHSWEIECLANEPKGAVFRVSHLKVAKA